MSARWAKERRGLFSQHLGIFMEGGRHKIIVEIRRQTTTNIYRPNSCLSDEIVNFVSNLSQNNGSSCQHAQIAALTTHMPL